MSDISQVGIIGAGTMGHALALVHALGDLDVRLTDSDAQVLAAAPGLIDSALATMVDGQAITDGAAQEAKNRIIICDTLESCIDSTDLIVEAIVEKPDLKRVLFGRLEQHAPKDAIIASNTSYLDVFTLLPDSLQARTLVAHWYTPPYIVDLVDVAKGPDTRDEYRDQIVSLYQRFGKQVISFDTLVPGYIANRLQSALTLEAFRLMDEGVASAADIDSSIRHGLALRLTLLGHLKKADYTGLEMVQNALANRMYEPPQNMGGSHTLDALIEAGRTGVRAGAGFYEYGDAAASTLFRERDIKLLELKRAIAAVGDL